MVFWRRRRLRIRGIRDFAITGETRERLDRTTRKIFAKLKKNVPDTLSPSGQIHFITNVCSAYSARKALQFAIFNFGTRHRKLGIYRTVRKLIVEQVSPDYAPRQSHAAKSIINEELLKILKYENKIAEFWRIFDFYYADYQGHFRRLINNAYR